MLKTISLQESAADYEMVLQLEVVTTAMSVQHVRHTETVMTALRVLHMETAMAHQPAVVTTATSVQLVQPFGRVAALARQRVWPRLLGL